MKPAVASQLALFCILLSASAVAWAGPTTAPVRVDTDPMAWTEPTQTPPILPEPDGDIHDSLVDAVFARAKALDTGKGPAVGLEVLSVQPESAAENAKLEAGDVLISIEGKPLRTAEELMSDRKTAQADEMFRVWSKSTDQLRLVTFPPGLLGVTVRFIWHLDRQYVLSLPDGEKPDADLLAACMLVGSRHPAAAQNALARAVAAGKTSRLTNLLEMSIASEDLRYDDVVAFGALAMKEQPECQFLIAPIVRVAAIATFRWPLAMDLQIRFSSSIRKMDDQDDSAERIADAVSQFQKMPVKAMANPIDEFSRLHFVDRSKDPIAITLANVATSNKGVDEFNNQQHMDFDIPDARSFTSFMGPVGKNAEFGATVHFKASDDTHSESVKTIMMLLADTKTQLNSVALQIDHTGVATFHGPNNSRLCHIDLFSQMHDDRKYKVALCVVGNRAEIVLDGKRIFYGPVLADPATRKLTGMIKVQGIKGTIEDLTWRMSDDDVP